MRRLGSKELALALVAAIEGDEKNAHSVRSEECADGVELFGENLENDEREGELAQGRAHIRALKGTLGRAYFDQPARRRNSVRTRLDLLNGSWTRCLQADDTFLTGSTDGHVVTYS